MPGNAGQFRPKSAAATDSSADSNTTALTAPRRPASLIPPRLPRAPRAPRAPKPAKPNPVTLDDFSNQDPDQIPIHLDRRNKKGILSLWKKQIKIHPKKFISDFTKHMDIDHSNSRFYLEKSNDKKGLRFVLNGQTNEGHEFYIKRTINNGVVSHDYFKIDQKLQGNDFGKQLFRNQISLYKKLNVKKIEVHANIDVGGYAWAKYGFTAKKDSYIYNQTIDRTRRFADELSVWDVQTKRALHALANNWETRLKREFDPKMIWEIADCNIKVPHGNKTISFGKKILMDSNWWGDLDLQDSDCSERLYRYVNYKEEEEEHPAPITEEFVYENYMTEDTPQKKTYSNLPKKGSEFFYLENGKRKDAGLHNYILNNKEASDYCRHKSMLRAIAHGLPKKYAELIYLYTDRK
jgi:hypothetical protein